MCYVFVPLPNNTMLGIIAISFLLLGLINCATVHNKCVDCTLLGKVWCPELSKCVLQAAECSVIPQKIKWFKNEGTCSTQPVFSPELCPELEVKFDHRLGKSISGNMIMVPVQPRLLVFDPLSAQEYDVGGYFSSVPSSSLQQPEFFDFGQAVDKFVATLHFDPYYATQSDAFSQNATQVIQFLDLTVVGNLNEKYDMTFIVSRKSNVTTNSTCAFTPSLVFDQTPTYVDFVTTLCAVGLVVWTLGTFAFVNFMLYYNKREREEEKEKKEKKEEKGTEMEEKGERALLTADSDSDSDSPAEISPKKGKASVYFSLLKAEFNKFVRSVSMSDKVLLAEYGVTLYHYIWFHRMAIIYITACTFIAGIMALPADLVWGSNRDVVAGDFATSTVASLNMDSLGYLIHVFIVIINVSLSVVFVWTLRKRSFAIVVAEEQQTLPAQEFAVEIKGIPKGVINEKMVQAHFEHVYGADHIVSVHLPLAYGPLYWKLESLKEKKEHYEKEFEHKNQRPLIFAHFWHVIDAKKKVDAIDYYESKIHDLVQKLPTPSQGTGFLYVTFTDRDVVRTCLKNNNHSTRWDWYIKITNLFKRTTERRPSKINPHFTAPNSEVLNCQKWKVGPAPVPSEINWKNLENSKKEKTGLQILALIIEVVVLTSVLSVTLLFAIIEVVRDLYLTDVYYKFGGANIIESVASLIAVVLPEAVAIIEEIVAPVVETVEERAGHIHKSGWRRAVMWHTAFFELMSGLVISRMIYFLIGVAVLYDADAPLNSYHYLFNKTGMDMMKYMSIKTFTVYGIKYPALCLLKLVQARFTGEFERPEFDYFDLYAQKIIVMFCAVVYGSVMPLILPLCMVYLSISYIYDRWAIVNFHQKDTLHDTRLLFYAADICSFYFSIVPLATLLIISKLFLYWPVLATVLIVFSGVVGLVMLETRRWQYMNQNLKGVRKIIKVSDRSFGAVISSVDDPPIMEIAEENTEGEIEIEGGEGGEGEGGTSNAIESPDSRTNRLSLTIARTRNIHKGIAKWMRERVRPATLESGIRTEEEILRSAYIHPLSKDK